MSNTHSTSHNLFSELNFKFPWRKYQSMVLNKFTGEFLFKKKLHIVAPPGSGKTILGLELIKRIGEPAVIFSPTSTIQGQWKNKVSMFLPENSTFLNEIASKDPNNIKLINSYTYQLVSSPSENLEFIEEAALTEWKESYVLEGLREGVEEAEKFINEIKTNNPIEYKKYLSKYYKKIKSKFLEDPQFDTKLIIHENAKKLIQDIVKAGVKTVVLDESHHMLDYWAAVIKSLLKEIGDYKLIGLTATPPIGNTKQELDNYFTLMGEIDFEVPAPAVVKEGNLAPYQDLVYFVNPTGTELKFIKKIQTSFETTVAAITNSEKFNNWFLSQKWERKIEENPILAVSAMKYYIYKKLPIPNSLVLFEEAYKPIYLDNWVELLSDYALNKLLTSDSPKDHTDFKQLKSVLKDFGFTLTEKGIRQQRSPSDKILALSESKSKAVVTILTEEMKSLGQGVRAVIITDFETKSSFTKNHLKDVMSPLSGGAVFVHRLIVHDRITTKLEAILVTGKQVLIDADEREVIINAMEEWKVSNKLDFKLSVYKTEFDNILSIEGSGKDWKTNTYVRMITNLFEKGVTKCIVGTRGLLAEGWDTLSLNTLIDLTTATTSTMVQQIRGRSLRLDPANPQKLANNWDVVCVEPHFEKGDQDFLRLIKKHSRFFGISENGEITKGLAHISEKLFFELITSGFKNMVLTSINIAMLNKSRRRENAYKAWRIGDDFSNVNYFSTQIAPKDIKFKTVGTLRDSIKAIFNILITRLIFLTTSYWFIIFRLNLLEIGGGILLICIITLFFIVLIVFSFAQIVTYIRKSFIELPVDLYVKDIAKCVLSTLRELNMIERSSSTDDIRISFTAQGYISVYLDYSNEKDTKLFSEVFFEMFEPLINQRYIVERSEADMKLGIYTPIWVFLRNIYGSLFEQEKTAYHPVPKEFGIKKKYAEVFHANWRKFVGGGKLIYTRSAEGAKLLITERGKRFNRVKRANLDLWK